MEKLFIQAQEFYERSTGDPHEIVIWFMWIGRKCYEVRVDDEFYASAESRAHAWDRVVDVIRSNNWSPVPHREYRSKV